MISLCEITGNTFPEILCLSDVDDRAILIGKEVAAGGMGERGEGDHQTHCIQATRT
jgi:hypothetical protein